MDMGSFLYGYLLGGGLVALYVVWQGLKFNKKVLKSSNSSPWDQSHEVIDDWNEERFLERERERNSLQSLYRYQR